MSKNHLTMGAALAILLLPLLAIGGDLGDEPGYIDLEWIPIPSHAAEVQDIDLSAVLLSIAADADEAGDPDLARALSMVRSIRVKAYSIDDRDLPDAEEAVAKVTKRLEKEDWKRLIYVKNDEETLTVSTRRDDGDLVGLMIVVFDPGEQVAFVNVVGDLDLGTLFQLAKKFDTDDLEGWIEEMDDGAGAKVHVD